ncbi:hypothetical protein E2C01_036511 [Portunus trituberculatus]|uniref:Uncharacterized protein n=1 Tax=Portunus trituberculatus TaxID=210409 RepID=A0A5B7F6X0_PORTR|nr:hypothetical protein [Portunus trituberculatus]
MMAVQYFSSFIGLMGEEAGSCQGGPQRRCWWRQEWRRWLRSQSSMAGKLTDRVLVLCVFTSGARVLPSQQVVDCVQFLRVILVSCFILWTWLGSRFSFSCGLLHLLVEARQSEVAGLNRCLPRRRSRLLLLPPLPRRSQPLPLGLHGKVDRLLDKVAGDFSAILVCGSMRFRRLIVGSLYRVDRCASAGVG